MTMHLHHLTGCAPAPLAFYLKALGILRIVGEQADEDARGWWQDEHFCLLTTLDGAALEEFFLERYAPTAVFNPWGARSGFYPGSSEKASRVALEKIEQSSLPRLAAFRNAVAIARAVVRDTGGEKPETDDDKLRMLSSLRSAIRGPASDWMNTVLGFVGDDYWTPAILGTGGNEGSGSYTSAYFAAVVACLLNRTEQTALHLGPTHSAGLRGAANSLWAGSFGQFVPDGRATAWDLLLAIEGTLMFRSAIALRSAQSSGGSARFLSSPFYFAAQAVGLGSMAAIDEFSLNKGRRNPGRGEQWFPLWTAPTGVRELAATIAEGRCSLGRQRAGRPVEAAAAIGALGVARGLSAFARYGYLQRNNLATHFAVPLGRIDLRERRNSRLVDDLLKWGRRLHGLATNDAPARLVVAERRLSDAVFAVLTHDDEAARWQEVLMAAARVEEIQVNGAAFEAGPIPPLSPGWVCAADDGTVEWRLACALGSAAAGYDRWRRPADPVRHHWLPLEPGAMRFSQKEKRLVRSVRVVMSGRSPTSDLGAIVLRRLAEAEAVGRRLLPLASVPGLEAQPADIARFIAGGIDDERLSSLARALMAVRWRDWPRQPAAAPAPGPVPDEPWVAIRLAFLPWPLHGDRSIPADQSIVRRLQAGDGAAAVGMALRRLRSVGLRPPLRAACVDVSTATRWAAALAFPISRRAAEKMAESFEALT